MNNDEKLSFKYHLALYQHLIPDNSSVNDSWNQKAEKKHALSVCSAVRWLLPSLTDLSQKVNSSEAQFHLRHGAARRTKLIWHSFRRIFDLIPPDRANPISYEDVVELTRDLNVIYVNIRGTLDNFASCLLHSFGAEETIRNLESNPFKVDLFGKEFQKDNNLSEFVSYINNFTKWNSQLKDLRNSSAHRIPLSVPPTTLTESEKAEYLRLWAEAEHAEGEYLKSCESGYEDLVLYEKHKYLHEKMEELGTFEPVFVHDPKEKPIRVYPRVPEDIGKLVIIARGVLSLIDKKRQAV